MDSEQEKWAAFEALVQRFRDGEFGPVTFRSKAETLGIAREIIDFMRDKHSDECARNIRMQR